MRIASVRDLMTLFTEIGYPVIVADRCIDTLYPGLFPGDNTLFITGGEHCKTLRTIGQITGHFQRSGVHRNTRVYLVGGGTITDVGGFAASVYHRGVETVLVPTTLTGMVDAAIGGKTAVNHGKSKNCLGTFHFPDKTLICPEFTATLPERELRNGLAEIVKTILIGGFGPGFPIDEALLDTCVKSSDWSGAAGRSVISAVAGVKQALCLEDPYDRANRRLLNLGHTFGHVIEGLTGYTISHGDGVSMGMRLAVRLSLELGLLQQHEAGGIETLLDRYGLPKIPLMQDIPRLKTKIDRLQRGDKKRGDRAVLILFRSPQNVIIHTLDKGFDLSGWMTRQLSGS